MMSGQYCSCPAQELLALPTPPAGASPTEPCPAYPADEARPQFAEIFAVKGTDARVEFPSQEKVVDGIAWRTAESEVASKHPSLPPSVPHGNPLSPEFPPGARAKAGAISAFR